jgi:hypothetical protein
MINLSATVLESSLTPPNFEGKKNDLDTAVTLPTDEAANNCYSTARQRLLTPSVWHTLCGPLSGTFTLTDTYGATLNRAAALNDYIRIDIPAPGNISGKGHDWVRIDALEELHGGNEALCAIRLRPAPAPVQPDEDSTSHFFKEQASSTFIIHRIANVVKCSYHGRNETPNTDTENTLDNIRNAVVATGAIAGLSEAQWSALIEGFLSGE